MKREDHREKFPMVTSRQEIEGLVEKARKEYPGCRPSQAIANKYRMTREQMEALWEESSINNAIDTLEAFFVTEEYQY